MSQVPTVRGPVGTADPGPTDPMVDMLTGDTTDCDHLAELADAGFMLTANPRRFFEKTG